MGNRTFKIFLIKPSHYDDDGYVIQWRLSTIPSNSLASVYGLLAACREERALGPDVDIDIELDMAKTGKPRGTLDLLILKALALAPLHGVGIVRRISQITRALQGE